eukprot:ctg_478.g238
MSGAPARRKSLIPLSGPSGAPVPEPDRAGLATPASAGRGRLRPQVTVTGARVDPRPLGDRHYMQACVRNLICYLSEHHFEHAISPKTLANPSAKDFQAIFTFLIRQLDPNFQWSGKFEDEVPQLLKRLQYPFTVSKSALYAVGSPHTWPTLLGCLTWLVELLVYDAEARVIKERETETLMRQAGMLEGGAETDGGVDLDEERAAASRAAADERLFFDYLTATYEAFLAGADDFDEFDRELDTALGSRTTHAESQVQELETRLATAKRHIEQLQSQSQAAQASLMSLAQKREDYSTDLEKFRKLIAQLESHKGMLERKCAERQTDLERKCAEHERLSAEVDALKERLARQQLNAVDVERIARKRRDLRANQDRVRQALTEAERKLKDAEAARDQVQSRVDDARRSLRGAAEGVGLSASTVAEDASATDRPADRTPGWGDRRLAGGAADAAGEDRCRGRAGDAAAQRQQHARAETPAPRVGLQGGARDDGQSATRAGRRGRGTAGRHRQAARGESRGDASQPAGYRGQAGRVARSGARRGAGAGSPARVAPGSGGETDRAQDPHSGDTRGAERDRGAALGGRNGQPTADHRRVAAGGGVEADRKAGAALAGRSDSGGDIVQAGTTAAAPAAGRERPTERRARPGAIVGATRQAYRVTDTPVAPAPR